MKVIGIIAEYNPFHNGHAYQYEQVRSRYGADYVIAVMSGDFVQRGEPAIYNKYTRTSAALNAGADLVLELPTAYATSSAEDFASCAVALLDKLSVVDEICFGSECGNVDVLTAIAAVLAAEPVEYQEYLRKYLKTGQTFPQARNHALLSWLAGQPSMSNTEAWTGILTAPNNILGIEYIKALSRRNSRIKPVTITRVGHGYHDLDTNLGFASASGLRAIVKDIHGTGFPSTGSGQVPEAAKALYHSATAVFASDLSFLLNETLLRLEHQGIAFHSYADVSEEMAARLHNHLLEFCTFEQRIEQLKTRQYTYTRINRALLHLVLGIKKSEMDAYRALDHAPYARVLGFKKSAAPLLSKIKQNARIPLITKTANARNRLDQSAYQMFEKDLYCSHVYQAIEYKKSGEIPRNEYTRSVIVIP